MSLKDNLKDNLTDFPQHQTIREKIENRYENNSKSQNEKSPISLSELLMHKKEQSYGSLHKLGNELGAKSN